MKKIILKCKLSSKDAFEQKFSDIDIDFSPVFWQHDRVYVPRGYKNGLNFPRLIMRTEMWSVDRPPKYSLILKRHIEDSGVDVVEETIIKDYTKMANIILQLGFKQHAEISRRRQQLKMDDTVFYIDKVEGLEGYYAKIETPLDQDDSAEKVKKELEKTLVTFDEHNFVSKAYFELSS